MQLRRRLTHGAVVLMSVATVAAAVGGNALADPEPTSTEATTTTTSSSVVPAAPPATGQVTAQAGPVAFTTIQGEGCRLATIDLTTGVVTALPASATALACVNDLGFGADGVLYGIKQQEPGPLTVHLLRFDTTTGAPTDLGVITGNFTSSTMFGDIEGGVAAGSDNLLYVDMGTNDPVCTAGDFQCLYRVDPATLVATLIGPPGTPGDQFDDKSLFPVTADCAGSFWVGWFPESTHLLSLASLALATGAGTPGPALGTPDQLDGLEIDKSTNTMYALAEGQTGESVYIVDRTTGAATLVAPVTELIGRAFRLAIPGSCPVAAVVQARFTG